VNLSALLLCSLKFSNRDDDLRNYNTEVNRPVNPRREAVKHMGSHTQQRLQ